MRGEHNDGNDLFRPTGPQIFSHPVELSPRAGRRHALYEKEGSLKKNRPLPPGMTSRSPRLEPLSYDFRLQPPPWGVETGAAPGESSYNTSYRQPGESSYRAIPTRYQSSPRTKLGTTSTIGGIIFGDDASSQPFPTGNSPRLTSLLYDPFADSPRTRGARVPVDAREAALATPAKKLALLNVALAHERRKLAIARGALTTRLRGSCFVPPDKVSLCGIVD